MSSPTPEAAPRQRLFFALWPDGAVRERITTRLKATGRARRLRGRWLPAANWHITLRFLGPVDTATRAALEAGADTLAAPPFELVLDALGYWRRARVAWLGASATPAPLQYLVDGLEAAAVAAGLDAESRRFHPHLTLLRRAAPMRGETLVEPVVWPVSRFVLVESDTQPDGARYSVLREWPLVPGDR